MNALLILEIILTALGLFVVIQLIQACMLEGFGIFTKGGRFTQERGYMKFRFKGLFIGM